MYYIPHNRSVKNINYQRRKLEHRTSAECVQSHRTDKTKEEKTDPRKKRSCPYSSRRVGGSRSSMRSSVSDVGATYQRLIEKVFGSQIRRNMEVNANEMVIKSDSEEEMPAHIEETLGRLRVINLKLNPRNAPSE
ncbi:hypothetical protein Tco_1444534 [Tanacetum coccineum]